MSFAHDAIYFFHNEQKSILIDQIFSQSFFIGQEGCKQVLHKVCLITITHTKLPYAAQTANLYSLIKHKRITPLPYIIANPKYTKKYMHNHKGEFPVYSSQTSKLGEIGSIDTYDYEEECFTWTTDGTYVETVFYMVSFQ